MFKHVQTCFEKRVLGETGGRRLWMRNMYYLDDTGDTSDEVMMKNLIKPFENFYVKKLFDSLEAHVL